MPEKNKTVAFTGKRPQHLPWGNNETDERCILLKQSIQHEVERAIRDGYCHFITGMALGVDTWAAECVLAAQAAYPAVTLEAAQPCPEQAARWSAENQTRYTHILHHCQTVTCVSPHYTPYCMHQRNRYMVERASRLIAVTDGETGGTGSTMQYARRHQLDIVVIGIC